MSKYKRAFVEKLKAEGWDMDSGDIVLPVMPNLADLLSPPQGPSQTLPEPHKDE